MPHYYYDDNGRLVAQTNSVEKSSVSVELVRNFLSAFDAWKALLDDRTFRVDSIAKAHDRMMAARDVLGAELDE